MKALQIIASLLLPGLGQLLQERADIALLHFGGVVAIHLLSFLICIPGAGLVLHLYSAYDAATWKGE